MPILMKAGDTAPAVRATLLDVEGDPVDLTGASVKFILASQGDPHTVLVDEAAELEDAATGKVVYQWVDGDTDTPGSYDVEFEVVYLDGTVQTFPTVGFLSCTIGDDLGGTQ